MSQGVCDICGTELKELLFSRYCPNEDNHGKPAGTVVSVTVDKTNTITFSGPPSPGALWYTTPQGTLQSYSKNHDIKVTDWLYNAQKNEYYFPYVMVIPGRMLLSSSVHTSSSFASAYISGQHIKNKTHTEITVVCVTKAPLDCRLYYDCLYTT